MMNHVISVSHKRIRISLQILNVFWYYILRRIHPFIYCVHMCSRHHGYEYIQEKQIL